MHLQEDGFASIIAKKWFCKAPDPEVNGQGTGPYLPNEFILLRKIEKLASRGTRVATR